jgi:hypothetical protein
MLHIAIVAEKYLSGEEQGVPHLARLPHLILLGVYDGANKKNGSSGQGIFLTFSATPTVQVGQWLGT